MAVSVGTMIIAPNKEERSSELEYKFIALEFNDHIHVI